MPTFKATLLIVILTLISIKFSAVQAKPEIRMLTTGSEYFPFASENAPEGGWSVAIIKAVFSEMDEQIEIDILPWKRGYQWTLDGRYSGTFPYVHTQERNQHFLYSNPINFVPVRVFVATNSDIKHIQDLYKKALCLPYGYTLDSRSEKLFKQYRLRITQAKDAKGCASQVLKGWSDFSLINGYFTQSDLLQRFGSLNSFRILEDEIAEIPLHFILPSNSPNAQHTMQRFNKALNSLSQSGDIAQIDSFYMGRLFAQQ